MRLTTWRQKAATNLQESLHRLLTPSPAKELASRAAQNNRLEAALTVERARADEMAVEKDAWKEVARRTGICMSCAVPNSYDPCTDCLGTGWDNGNDPFARADAAERIAAAFVRAMEAQCEPLSPTPPAEGEG
jgi:hypothetical protein